MFLLVFSTGLHKKISVEGDSSNYPIQYQIGIGHRTNTKTELIVAWTLMTIEEHKHKKYLDLGGFKMRYRLAYRCSKARGIKSSYLQTQNWKEVTSKIFNSNISKGNSSIVLYRCGLDTF